MLINCLNSTFNNFIKLGKDLLHNHMKSGVVYKINCLDCNALYIGQTSRQLKKRMYEHDRSVKKLDERSVISSHCHKYTHSFDFDNVQVLDSEKNKFRREFSEMLHIFLHTNNINKKLDICFLKNTYKNSLKKFQIVS